MEGRTAMIFFLQIHYKSIYLGKKIKNQAPVVLSQFSETFTWGLMGNRKISNIFGDYCSQKGNGTLPGSGTRTHTW